MTDKILQKLNKQLKFGVLDNGNVITAPFRVSYPNVFEPQLNELNNKEQYNLTMLFDKDTDFSEFQNRIKEVAKEKFGANGFNGLTFPQIKDGNLQFIKDKKGNETNEIKLGYEGKKVLAVVAEVEKKPQILDLNAQPIISSQPGEEGFYGGCYARATLQVFAYKNIKKGVTLRLNNIQKLGDGEPFGAVKASAESEFKSLDLENVSEEQDGNKSNDPFATM